MAASRGAVVAGAIGIGLVVVVVVGGGPGDAGAPLDPRSDAPLGTSALVSLLEGLGAEVDLSTGLPDAGDDVALVLRDRLDEDQADDLRSWVRAGGTLVVTDASSPLTPEVVAVQAPGDDEDLAPGFCDVVAVADVDRVDGGAASSYAAGSADGRCFGSRNTAFLAVTEDGSGEVVSVGGGAFLTNERLDHADNAVLAAALLAPSGRETVRVVDAPLPAGGGDRTLSDLIDDGVRRFGLQLAIAFALYALWRSIRLGRPVPEEQPVDIAGSELVAATGRLLERTRAPGAAAEVLRGGLRRALRARLGLPVDAPPGALADLVVDHTSLDRAAVEAALGDHPVTTDAELAEVARAVTSVHQEVFT